MYEAMRHRAPISSQAVGASVTALVMALTGYVALSGIGGGIVEAVLKPTTIVTVPTETPPFTRDELLVSRVDETFTLPKPKPVPLDPTIFDVENDTRIVVTPTSPGETFTGRTGPAPLPAPVITAPRIRPMDPPPYPPTAIRARLQGVTGLDACIDARGRVSSVQLAVSSGHKRLDEEAMKWVRGARFEPATRNGATEAVCGHRIDYEWRLVDAQR